MEKLNSKKFEKFEKSKLQNLKSIKGGGGSWEVYTTNGDTLDKNWCDSDGCQVV